MNERKLRVGSLFSGIGGIELGLERAGGFETAWFVECDKYAQAVLRKHWPNATIYDDITTIDFGTVPKVDVLTGGFPCQDISNAGKRAGITGSRSGLWKHYLRAISTLRPQLVIAENVAALTRRGLDTVLCDLAQIGYDAEWHCVSASSVGAPHRRDRIFILAYHNSSRCVHRELDQFSSEGGESSQPWTVQGCAELANPNKLGSSCGCNGHNQICKSCCGSESSETRSKTRNWSIEPDVGRVAHGISDRVDRIKCLGNSVVPQVAEAIGKAINKTRGE